MTKEEKIKKAYGEHWFEMEDYMQEIVLQNNGWISTMFMPGYNAFSGEHVNIEIEKDNGIVRPKSLQGIENNNGWIKIESENMILPIDGTEVHFYHSFTNENGAQTEYHKGIFNAALGFTSYYDSENYKVKEITHYQPIEKPKPPLY